MNLFTMKLFIILLLLCVHDLVLHKECAGNEGEWCGDTDNAECAPGLWCLIKSGNRHGKCVSKIYFIHCTRAFILDLAPA